MYNCPGWKGGMSENVEALMHTLSGRGLGRTLSFCLVGRNLDGHLYAGARFPPEL